MLPEAALVLQDTVPVCAPQILVPSELSSSDTVAPIYDVLGITNHTGSLHLGHYTATCRCALDGSWYRCNDKIISKTTLSLRHSSQPYIMMYRQRD